MYYCIPSCTSRVLLDVYLIHAWSMHSFVWWSHHQNIGVTPALAGFKPNTDTPHNYTPIWQTYFVLHSLSIYLCILLLLYIESDEVASASSVNQFFHRPGGNHPRRGVINALLCIIILCYMSLSRGILAATHVSTIKWLHYWHPY